MNNQWDTTIVFEEKILGDTLLLNQTSGTGGSSFLKDSIIYFVVQHFTLSYVERLRVYTYNIHTREIDTLQLFDNDTNELKIEKIIIVSAIPFIPFFVAACIHFYNPIISSAFACFCYIAI